MEQDRWHKASATWAAEALSLRRSADKLNRAFLPFLNATTPQTILDLACGIGEPLKTFQTQLHPENFYVGIDFVPNMVVAAAQQAPKLSFCAADIAALPFPNATFDAITSRFGIMFLSEEQMNQLIEKIDLLLKPQGKAIFMVWGAIEKNTIWQLINCAYRSVKSDQEWDYLSPLFKLSTNQKITQICPPSLQNQIQIQTKNFTQTLPFSMELFESSVKLLLAEWLAHLPCQEKTLFKQKLHNIAVQHCDLTNKITLNTQVKLIIYSK